MGQLVPACRENHGTRKPLIPGQVRGLLGTGIQEHGGNIFILSAPGKETAFTIKVPLASPIAK